MAVYDVDEGDDVEDLDLEKQVSKMLYENKLMIGFSGRSPICIIRTCQNKIWKIRIKFNRSSEKGICR